MSRDAKAELTHCGQTFPAEVIEFDHATGGCDSCGYGASAYLTLKGTCPVCVKPVEKEVIV